MEMVYEKEKLTDAQVYCDTKPECVGVAKHPNGKYTPRCGCIEATNNMAWLNKNDCYEIGNNKILNGNVTIF